MSNRWTIALLWLFLYGSFALLSPPLLDGADALHAEIAREMVVRGDAVTLYANGIRQLEQAPLLYWSIAGSMRVFGAGAAQARVPIAIAVLFLALLVEAFARQAFQSSRTGLYAAGCVLLSPALFLSTRILGPDAFASLWFMAAVLCLWQAEAAPRERTGEAQVLPCLGFAAACALDVLTTGPGGLSLPAATALLYLVATRGTRGTLRRLGKLHPMLALAVFAVIAAPWHVLAAGANPAEGHPARFLQNGSMQHVWLAGTPSVGNVHSWAWFYFVGRYLPHHPGMGSGIAAISAVVLVLCLSPWSAFLPAALRGVPWRRPAGSLTRGERLRLLLAIATILPVLFWSMSGKGTCSALPALPFLCMLIAQWLDGEALEADAMAVPAPLGRTGLRVAVGLVAAGTSAALACGVLLLRAEPAPQADLAALLRHAPDHTGLSFALFARAAAAGALRGPLIITGTALLVGTLLNWHLRRAYRPDAGNRALATATLLCLTAAHVALNTLAPVLSSQPLAATIAPLLRAKNRIVVNEDSQAAATLGFYLERSDLRSLQNPGARPAAACFSDAPAAFETENSLREQWTGPERIFLWTDPAKLPALPSKAFIIAEGGGKQIVSNKTGPY